ncbi:hypothetical protein Tco_0848107, partial [Tanacetum coccineum]
MTSFDYRLNPIYAIKECSSCGSLYTSNCGCSKGSLEDKILVPKPPRNCARCARCGTPVDGPYCQGCALLRKKFKENLFTYGVENEFFEDLQDTSESSDDNTNVVNAPQEPIVVNQDPGENSSHIQLHIDHCCHECGDSLDGIFCRQCTCKSCGKGAHYGYNCPPKVPIISNPEPCKNQTIDEPLQNLQGLQQQCLLGTCQKCGCNEYNGVCFHCKVGWKTSIHCFQLRTLLTILQVLQTILHNHNTYHTLVRYVGTILITVTIVNLKSRFYTKEGREKEIAEDQRGQANDRYWKIPICDDDDKDNTIAITPVLPIEEPDNSLNRRDSSGSPLLILSYLFLIIKLSTLITIILKRGVVAIPILCDFYHYDSVYLDLSNDQFPPTDRSDLNHEEFADELAHIISPPEYDHFCFKNEPELGNLTMDVVNDIFPTREPRVHVPNDCPDSEASRARGFVLRSQELHILSFIWESDILILSTN